MGRDGSGEGRSENVEGGEAGSGGEEEGREEGMGAAEDMEIMNQGSIGQGLP